jgi:hypothetical protein
VLIGAEPLYTNLRPIRHLSILRWYMEKCQGRAMTVATPFGNPKAFVSHRLFAMQFA